VETGDTAFPSDNPSTHSTNVDVDSSMLLDCDNIANSSVDACSQQTSVAGDMSTSYNTGTTNVSMCYNNASRAKSCKRTRSTQTHDCSSSMTPRKVLLRKQLRNVGAKNRRMQKRLFTFKQKYERKLSHIYGTRVHGVESVIENVGKHLKGECLSFVAHQLRMCGRNAKGRRYSNEIRLLAISLYNAGPKAHKYFLKFLYCLVKCHLPDG
jgi:hypothetical protein